MSYAEPLLLQTSTYQETQPNFTEDLQPARFNPAARPQAAVQPNFPPEREQRSMCPSRAVHRSWTKKSVSQLLQKFVDQHRFLP
jgi:hypothetical protein